MVGKFLRKRRGFKKVYVSVTDDVLPPRPRPDYTAEEVLAMDGARA